MNRYRFFWGILVLMLGVMLLLNTLGILSISAWNIFWPLVLVAVGGWLLLGGAFSKRPSLENQNLYIPLSQASSINLRLKHAAGRLHIASGSLSSQDALSGSFLGGVDYESLQEDSALNIRLKARQGCSGTPSPLVVFKDSPGIFSSTARFR